jgi:two-component system, response regulator PdtaR
MVQDNPVLLLVEDDGLLRATLADAMTYAGFAVLQAEDAQGALVRVLDRRDIAALLTDILLPGEADGFALARAARVLRPDLVVLYVSGDGAPAGRWRGVAGARFLTKPFAPSHAGDALHAMLQVGKRAARGDPAPPRQVFNRLDPWRMS